MEQCDIIDNKLKIDKYFIQFLFYVITIIDLFLLHHNGYRKMIYYDLSIKIFII